MKRAFALLLILLIAGCAHTEQTDTNTLPAEQNTSQQENAQPEQQENTADTWERLEAFEVVFESCPVASQHDGETPMYPEFTVTYQEQTFDGGLQYGKGPLANNPTQECSKGVSDFVGGACSTKIEGSNLYLQFKALTDIQEENFSATVTSDDASCESTSIRQLNTKSFTY